MESHVHARLPTDSAHCDKMAGISPCVDSKSKSGSFQLLGRLEQCWTEDLNWELFPSNLKEECHQVGTALSMPATAVLAGLILIVGYSMSHSVVAVEGTDWVEPILVWISICMPTGSGKSALCKYLHKIVDDTRANCRIDDDQPPWFFDDQSIEKLGALMGENNWKLLGLFDELPMFLAQMNIYRGKGISDSHELALLLKLYGGTEWNRRTVSGDANFSMNYTALTVGGFMQPSVARTVIELQGNADKGFSQRFLWCAPKPRMVRFSELQKVDMDFSASIVGLMTSLWKNGKQITTWNLRSSCVIFQEKFDATQDQLQQVSCMGELLSGMLSKSKGQVLRVAAVLNALFQLETPLCISDTISDEAIKAAINFVDCCIQHAAYLAGRGDVQEAIRSFQKDQDQIIPHSDGQSHRNAGYSLLLPGRILHLNALLAMKKFRDRGNKEGAVKGFQLLVEAGLGKLNERKPPRGTNVLYTFEKAELPGEEELTTFGETLSRFGVSLQQYRASLEMEDITMAKLESRKRTQPQVVASRKSPRKALFTADN